MRWTRATLIVGALAYAALWVLALAGASALIEPLVIPLVLGVLVAGGVWLNRFVGVQPRRERFADREDDPPS